MEKKYILSLVLLISASSVFSMNPKPRRRVNHRQPRREEGALRERKEMREREARRAAFLVALANGTLVCGDNKLTFPGLLDQSGHATRMYLPISSLTSFVPTALKALEKAKTKSDAQNNFPRITDTQAYCIFAAHILFIKKSDLEAIDDPRFEANKRPEFKNLASKDVRDRIIGYRQGLVKAMKCESGEYKQDNIKILLEQPMHPWTKPLHILVDELNESEMIKKAE